MFQILKVFTAKETQQTSSSPGGRGLWSLHGPRRTTVGSIQLRWKGKNRTNVPVCLSSGWPVCWRSDRPRPYRTRPPRWSTRCSWPGGRPHLRPSLKVPTRWPHPPSLPSSGLSASSGSSVSSLVGFCNATPRLASQHSSWQTWPDTASCTSHVWMTHNKDVVLEYIDSKVMYWFAILRVFLCWQSCAALQECDWNLSAVTSGWCSFRMMFILHYCTTLHFQIAMYICTIIIDFSICLAFSLENIYIYFFNFS